MTELGARFHRRRGRARVAALALVLAALGAGAGAEEMGDATADARVEGYASALIDVLVVPAAPYAVEVHEGVLHLRLSEEARQSGVDWQQLAARLARIDGVERVVLEDLSPADSESLAEEEPRSVALLELWPGSGVLLLPRQDLFAPLLADPRWPRFGASILPYLDDQFDRVGATAFGETIPVLRGPVLDGQLELSLQAGVFSIFDFGFSSTALVNSDFQVGGLLSWQRGPFTVAARGLHQSSHLGDEYLLKTDIDRVNLSYEQLDLLVSLQPLPYLRLYGGGAYIVHRETKDLDRGSAQLGLELRSPRAYLDHHLRPLAAVDIGLLEESGWDPDVSLVWGVQLENALPLGVVVQFLGRYYNGRSPDGQFFTRDVEYVGFGADLYF